MKHSMLALAAAGLLAAALPSAAQARCDGCGIAAGVVGGLAAGAIIGSAIANSGPGPVYAAPPPPPPSAVYYDDEAAPVCHFEHRRYWDGYVWHSRRVEVCE
jgi:hypothetical protein